MRWVNCKHLIQACLMVAILWGMPSATASLILSDEGRAQALALLPRLIAATDADAHIHTVELNNRLARTGDPRERSAILKELIFHGLDIADINALDKVVIQARALADKNGDAELALYADLGRAGYHALNGEAATAEKMIRTAQAGAQARGDTLGVFFAEAVHATIGQDLGNFLEGLGTMAQATVTLPDTERGNRMRMMAYLTLAFTYTGVGEIGPILDYYGRALALAEREHIAFDRESALFNIASTLNDLEEKDLARQFYLALEQVIEQTGRTQGRYYVLYGLAWLDYDDGNYQKAIDQAVEALSKYESDPGFDYSLNDLAAMSYARLGQPAKAREYLEKSQAFFIGREHELAPGLEAEGLLTKAYIQWAEGDIEQAFQTLDAARKAQSQVQYARFKNSITDLRSSLETMLAKQRAEAALVRAEDAYSRLIVAFSIAIALGATALLVMQRRHTRMLKYSMQEAEIANRSKSEFLANMSHELRTPLNAILGFSEMMIHQVFGKLGARQYEEYVGHIHDSGRHLLDIINDILDLSKVESGRLTLKNTEIDIAPVYDDVKTLLSTRARDRGIGIEIDVPDDLPPLIADQRLVKQILLNLVSNSVKFTERGGTIMLSARQHENGALRLVISDTGIGMTRDELEIALTPFGQAGTTMTRSHEGTGLGLPLVKSLMELHQGDLIIQSFKGKGTTVTAAFPPARTAQSTADNSAVL